MSEESPWCAVAVRGSGARAAGRDGGSWPDSVRCLGRRCSLACSGNKTLSTTRPPTSSVSVSSQHRSSGPGGPSPTETNPRAWPADRSPILWSPPPQGACLPPDPGVAAGPWHRPRGENLSCCCCPGAPRSSTNQGMIRGWGVPQLLPLTPTASLELPGSGCPQALGTESAASPLSLNILSGI